MRSQFTKFAVLALVGGTFLAAPPASTTDGCPGPGRPARGLRRRGPPPAAREARGGRHRHRPRDQSEGPARARSDSTPSSPRIQAQKLRAEGLSVQRQEDQRRDGLRGGAPRRTLAGYDAYRSYSEPGGIADELRETAAAYPGITKLVTIGQTVQGKPILALKVTKNAKTLKDGKRPSVLYAGAQHAREWITPEMVRRLMHHYLEGYGTDAELTGIVNTTELWFLPVANPDGYDFTFTDERLWRKNLRDNDGDGTITPDDGVDPNRNFAVKWGWDNEGSSPDPDSETYRGTGPNSEPETTGPRPALRPDRVRVLHQLPLGRRAAALRHRLAGEHAVARRRDLRGDGRRRREPRGPRLRPGHLRRALHHQRRHRHPRHRRERHPRLHPRDDHLRDGLGLRSPTTSGSPRTASAASTSPTTRS